jgi:4-hydroxybenzoate polyprenyltransferase
MHREIQSSSSLLCVDLDGTLLKSNSFFEVCWYAMRRHPRLLFQLPLWLLSGQAEVWRQIVRYGPFPVDSWPLNTEAASFVKNQMKRRRVYLVTGASQTIAEQFANHFGGFSGVFGSKETHLVGDRKAQLLEQQFGAKLFDYLGDSKSDIPAWEACDNALTVASGSSLASLQSRMRCSLHSITGTVIPSTIDSLLACMRPHQWSKNLLVFAPALLGHGILNVSIFWACLEAFVSFSMVSSAMYLLNDCMDLEADRTHSAKCNRPVASGNLPIPNALLAALLLWVTATALALCTSPSLGAITVVYSLTVLLYSIGLKTILIVDLILLALFYVVRIFAGSAATGIPVSFWLSLYSLFLFFGLATLKRCSELHVAVLRGSPVSSRRAYLTEDNLALTVLGAGSHLVSILVVGLYIHSTEIVRLYGSPQILWLLCPVILCWCARLWILCGRGLVEEDPIIFAIRDRWSHATACIAILIGLGAKMQ